MYSVQSGSPSFETSLKSFPLQVRLSFSSYKKDWWSSEEKRKTYSILT